MQVGAAEEASAHEEKLVYLSLFGGSWSADKAADVEFGSLRRKVHKGIGDIHSHHIHYPVFEGLGLFEHIELATVVHERKCYFGMGYGYVDKLVHDVAQLDVVALEEFAPGGGVVEKVADYEVAALGGGDAG